MEILRIENLRKKFGTNEVLKGISLNVNKGDVISIIGKSGSGKSTFLRCINRLEEASEGNIYFEGKNIMDKDCDLKKSGLRWQWFFKILIYTII